MMSFLRALARHEGGATAIEYAVLAALIAVASATALRLIGGRLLATLGNLATVLG